jgi:hypothetical protein
MPTRAATKSCVVEGGNRLVMFSNSIEITVPL